MIPANMVVTDHFGNMGKRRKASEQDTAGNAMGEDVLCIESGNVETLLH